MIKKNKIIHLIFLIIITFIFTAIQFKYDKMFFNFSFFFKKNIDRTCDEKMQILKLENRSLLEKIDAKEQSKYFFSHKKDVIGTAKLEYLSINQNGNFIIAKSNDNIEKNDLVVDKNYNLIGRVLVYNPVLKSAKIQMINDRSSYIPITDSKNQRIGLLSYSSRCKYGIMAENFVSNDRLETYGLDNSLPSGIKIGFITDANGTPCVIPFANLNNISNMLVLRKKTYQQYDKELKI